MSSLSKEVKSLAEVEMDQNGLYKTFVRLEDSAGSVSTLIMNQTSHMSQIFTGAFPKSVVYLGATCPG